MTETPRRDLTFTDFLDDPWNVMRGRLPLDADVALLDAASDAAYAVIGRIMRAERRPGWDEQTAMLLELARMKVIGRIAMLHTWRNMRLGKLAIPLPKSMLDEDYPPDPRAFIPRRGEDSGYARMMRMKPEQLERVIALVEGAGSDDHLWQRGPKGRLLTPEDPDFGKPVEPRKPRAFTPEEIAQINRAADIMAERERKAMSERPLLLCWSCGWLHVGVPAPEPADECCYRCKGTEFRVIEHEEALRKIPRGVTLQAVRWPR